MRSAVAGHLLLLASALVLSVLARGWDLDAQAAKPTEYQVKAAYLANFVKFVDWPTGTNGAGDEPFHICVLGQDPFGPVLDAALAGEAVDRHPLAPRRVANAREAGGCRALFICSSDESQIKTALKALDKASVLTVSDFPEFLKWGGMIQFVLDGKRIRFEVNLTATKTAGLFLRSELLRVAAAVRRP